jgi:hypothetical protein
MSIAKWQGSFLVRAFKGSTFIPILNIILLKLPQKQYESNSCFFYFQDTILFSTILLIGTFNNDIYKPENKDCLKFQL